jgi:hypothetical protein
MHTALGETYHMTVLSFAIMAGPHTFKEKAKITAGAIASLVIVGWMAALALAILVTR